MSPPLGWLLGCLPEDHGVVCYGVRLEQTDMKIVRYFSTPIVSTCCPLQKSTTGRPALPCSPSPLIMAIEVQSDERRRQGEEEEEGDEEAQELVSSLVCNVASTLHY